jgi:hypothetical protein
MSIKTDYTYNEDDFVQSGESLNELTVTITLAEYRNLLREETRSAEKIESLEEQLKRERNSTQTFMRLFMLKSPETLNKICDLFNEIFPSNKTEAEEGEKTDSTIPEN